MTVSVTDAASGPFFPNGVTTSFPFDFSVDSGDEVRVARINADGTEENVSPAAYSVQLAADAEGGTIVFTAPPLNDGRELWVFLEPSFEQDILFEDEGPFNSAVLNPLADRAARRAIWLKSEVARSFRIPFGGAADGLFPVVLPGGQPGFSMGTGSDPALRGDLASSQGGKLIQVLLDGFGARAMSVEEALNAAPLRLERFLPLIWVKDGSVDYTSHVQRAMDAAATLGKQLIIPTAVIGVRGTGPLAPSGLQMRGERREGSIFSNPNGSAIRLNGDHYDFSGVYFASDGADVVNQVGPCNRSQFRRVGIQSGSNDKSLWDNNGFPYIANMYVDCYFQHTETATVPSFDIHGTGGTLNNNRFRDCWVQYSGNYFIRIDTDDDNAQYGNVFDGIIFEVCTGGGIQLKGNKGFVINDCYNWDVDDSTAYPVGQKKVKRDFYSILASDDGATSVGRITNCQRLAGTNEAGIVDVRLPGGGAGSGIVIENCSTVGGGDPFTVEAAGNFINAIAANTVCVIQNGQNATIFDPLSGAIFLPTSVNINGVKVVGQRVNGFGAIVGTADKSAITTYDVVAVSNPPTQGEVQALSGKMQEVTRRLKAMDDALRAHGLLG